MFTDESILPAAPDNVKIKVESRDVDPNTGTVTLVLMAQDGIDWGYAHLLQTETATAKGVGIQDYGVVMIPPTAIGEEFVLSLKIGDDYYDSTSQRWDNKSSTAGASTWTKRA